LESRITPGAAGICGVKTLIIVAILLAAVAVFWLGSRQTHTIVLSPSTKPAAFPEPSQPMVVTAKTASASSNSTPTEPAPLPGEIILRQYGDPSRPPEHDLTLMAQLMENYSLLVKSSAYRTLSANEDWAAAFRGTNQIHLRFLPDQHRAFNAEGQLVDRWGTPLFFHPLGSHRYEIRSAGPDRKLWTDDDIHRGADGSFQTGPHLNSPDSVDR
jgi:hypothetical protein